MTEDERNKIKEKYQDDSLGVLIRKILLLLGKYLLALLVFILKLLLKGIVWCCKKCVKGIHAFKVFWNSNDTREKRKKIIERTRQCTRSFITWCKDKWPVIRKYTVICCKFLWKYICIGSRLLLKYFLIMIIAIYHGIIWTILTTKDLIIHSKPTFIRLGKSIKKGTIDFWHWLHRMARGIKLRHIRRKRAWKNFRRNKGFKGLLIDTGRGLNSGIRSFVSEEDSETSPEAITEDDILAEEIEERQQGDKHKLSKKIFKGVKDIVEEKD